MVATVLMGVGVGVLLGGVLLGGALLAAFGDRARFGAAPVFVVPRFARQSIAERDRGDPGVRQIAATESSDHSAVRVEQLNDAGSVRLFTRVSARLAEIDPEPPPVEDHQPVSNTVDNEGNGGRPALPELPPIILFGASHGSQPHGLSAYAEDEPPPRRLRLIEQPLNVTVVPKSPRSHDASQRVIVARAGDTLRAILSGLGAGAEDMRGILAHHRRRLRRTRRRAKRARD